MDPRSGQAFHLWTWVQHPDSKQYASALSLRLMHDKEQGPHHSNVLGCETERAPIEPRSPAGGASRVVTELCMLKDESGMKVLPSHLPRSQASALKAVTLAVNACNMVPIVQHQRLRRLERSETAPQAIVYAAKQSSDTKNEVQNITEGQSTAVTRVVHCYPEKC